jgi:hypothetical protein
VQSGLGLGNRPGDGFRNGGSHLFTIMDVYSCITDALASSSVALRLDHEQTDARDGGGGQGEYRGRRVADRA